MNKSLVVRARKYFWHYVDLSHDRFTDSEILDDQHTVWDVVCDSLKAVFVGNLALILACAVFRWPIAIMAGAYIIPVALSINYLKRRDINLAGRLLVMAWLLSNIFVAISMANNNWTWFLGNL